MAERREKLYADALSIFIKIREEKRRRERTSEDGLRTREKRTRKKNT